MRFHYLLTLSLLGCTDSTFDKPDDQPFALGEPGKADSMLSTADKNRLEQAFDAAIADAETTVANLQAEIAALEASHLAKQQEADALVQRIAAREQELRNQANNNLLLCAFFPDPSICFLSVMIANDSTLKSFRAQLDAARAEQQRIATEIAAYRANRDVLLAKLPAIRAGKQRVLSLLEAGTIAIPTELSGSVEAGRAFGRAALMRDLADAIAQEIGVLVDVRNAAVELSQVLDQSLETLRSLERSVDDLVTAQRERFMDAIVELLSGDPAALAERWLEDIIASKTKTLLDSLEFPLGEFARFLVDNRNNGGGNPDELLQKILAKLAAGGNALPPITVKAETDVQLHDLTTARSPLQMTDTRTPAALDVYVSIEHTYSGDLHVSLEKDGRAFVLSNRVGKDRDDIVKTFTITDLQGVSLAGTWTLVIADQEAGDVGRLRRWTLTAH